MKTVRQQIRTLIFLPLGVLCLAMAQAQDDSSESASAPSPPYVGELTGDFSLTKSFKYLAPPDGSTPSSRQVQEIDSVKSGPVRKDTEVYADNTSTTTWRKDDYRATASSAHPQSIIVNVVTPSASPKAMYKYQDDADFPELSWIQGPMYQGIQMKGGKKCFTYKMDDQTAWIDTETRLPVYFESKMQQVSYTYSAPPNEPLQLPDGYAEKIEKFKRLLRGQL